MIQGIHLYTGGRGSGKSNFVMPVAAEYLARGGHVVANFPAVWDGSKGLLRRVEDVYGVEVSRDQWVLLESCEGEHIMSKLVKGRDGKPTLLVIDECNIWWPQLGWDKGESKRFLQFIVQSRKDRVDVILVIQAPDNLSAEFRRQCQCEWFHANLLSYFGAVDLGKAFHFMPTLRVLHAMQYGKVRTDSHLRRQYRFDSPFWWHTYDTNHMFKDFNLACGVDWSPPKVSGRRQLRGLWRSSWKQLAAILLCVVAGCARAEKKEYAKLIDQMRKDRTDFQHGCESVLEALRKAGASGAVARTRMADAGPVGAFAGHQGTGRAKVSLTVVDIEGRYQEKDGWCVVQAGRRIGVGDPLDDGSVLLKATEHFGSTTSGDVVWRCSPRALAVSPVQQVGPIGLRSTAPGS